MESLGLIIGIICVGALFFYLIKCWWKNQKEKARQNTLAACKSFITRILEENIYYISNKQQAFASVYEKVRNYIYSNNIDSPSNFERTRLEQFIIECFSQEAIIQSIEKELWKFFDIYEEESKSHIQKVINKVIPVILQNLVRNIDMSDEEIINLLIKATEEIEKENQLNIRNLRYSLSVDKTTTTSPSSNHNLQKSFLVIQNHFDKSIINNPIISNDNEIKLIF